MRDALTRERWAEWRAYAALNESGLVLTPSELLALLDAADEVARLRAEVEHADRAAQQSEDHAEQRITALEAENAKLREALALAGLPLEVLHATERGGVALCGPVQDSIAVAVTVIREALSATAPKEQSP